MGVPTRLTIHWGTRTRDTETPSSALSAKVTLRNAKSFGGMVTWNINRAADTLQAYSETYSTPDEEQTGQREIQVEFYADADAQGAKVGIAAATLEPHAAGADGIILKAQGTIRTVRVNPGQTLSIGETKDLWFSARDTDDNVIAVAIGAAAWTLTSGSDKLSITTTGQVRGLASGLASVVVAIDGVASAAEFLTCTATSLLRLTGITSQSLTVPESRSIQNRAGKRPKQREQPRIQQPAFNGGNVMESSLWKKVEAVCKEMVEQGWNSVLEPHELYLSDTDGNPKIGEKLEAALRRPLRDESGEKTIEPSEIGFEDFHPDGECAIEPGCPAKSLLYHALASCRVPLPTEAQDRTQPDHSRLRFWIETIENYVYGVQPPRLDELIAQAAGKPLAVVVFAYDYRPADMTPHRRYADLCFSRTGVARVGTATAEYDPDTRAFQPFKPKERQKIPLLPARYGAFLATFEQGSKAFLGERYFRDDDSELGFWIPLRKLFTGTQCFADLPPLQLEFQTHHVNEKLRRFHVVMQERTFKTGWTEPFLSDSPFIFTEGIARQKPFCCPDAELDTDAPATLDDSSSILVVPQKHECLVEAAKYLLKSPPALAQTVPDAETNAELQAFADSDSLEDAPEAGTAQGEASKDDVSLQPLTYFLPENYVKFFRENDLESRENINVFANVHLENTENTGAGELRSAPEVIHARKQIQPHERDLSILPNVLGLVAAGGYEAQHYLDYTGDGWVQVDCPQIREQGLTSLAAYSLVAPPDFLPMVNQRQIMDWWSFDLPFPLKNRTQNRTQPQMTIWAKPPSALADARHPANLNLKDAHFSPRDTTMTAVVTQPILSDTIPPATPLPPCSRTSFLPDGASGIFAPGWDISLDVTKDRVVFLASYGGGSPFLEDSVSCAAINSFWPAAAPDVARIYPATPSNFRATVFPLTDKEIGQNGGTAWDGQTPPQVCLMPDGKEWVKYTSMENADYVAAALNHKFFLGDMAQISVEEYTRRVLAMSQVYAAMGANLLAPDRRQMLRDIGVPIVLSFREPESPADHAERASIEQQFSITLPTELYRWEMFLPGRMRVCPDDLCFRLIEIRSRTLLYTTATQTFWRKKPDDPWRRKFGII